jgi:hypothetical protein
MTFTSWRFSLKERKVFAKTSDFEKGIFTKEWSSAV